MSTTNTELLIALADIVDGVTYELGYDETYEVSNRVTSNGNTFLSDSYGSKIIIHDGGILELDDAKIHLLESGCEVRVESGGQLLLTDSHVRTSITIDGGAVASLVDTAFTNDIHNCGTLIMKGVQLQNDLSATLEIEPAAGSTVGAVLMIEDSDLTYTDSDGYTSLYGLQINEFSYLEAKRSKLGSVGTGMGLYVNDEARGKYSIENCELLSYVCVTKAADLAACSGNKFMERSTFQLVNYCGKTADLWNGSFELTQEGSYITFGAFMGNDSGKDIVLSAPPSKLNGGYGGGGYVMNALLGVILENGCTMTLEDGVCVDMNSATLMVDGSTFTACYSEVANALVSRPGKGSMSNCIDVERGGSFVAENANVLLDGNDGEVTVGFYGSGTFSMKGGTLSVSKGIYAERLGESKGGEIVLDGTHVTHTFANSTNIIERLDSFVISSEKSIVMKNLQVGPAAIIRARDHIVGVGDNLNEIHEGGWITLQNVVLSEATEVEVQAGGNLLMENCIFEDSEYTSSIELRGGYGNTIVINGCDLSAVDVTIKELSNGCSIDLSGNYWGTTNEEEIKAKLGLFDSSVVELGDILTAPPLKPDYEGPVVTLDTPNACKIGKNKNEVTLNWTADEEVVSYEVTAAGNIVYQGTGNSCTFEYTDDAFAYSVKATDKAGNISITQAMAPGLVFDAPKISADSQNGDGYVRLTFNWTPSVASKYAFAIQDSSGEIAILDSGTVMAMESEISFSVPVGFVADYILLISDYSNGDMLLKRIDSFQANEVGSATVWLESTTPELTKTGEISWRGDAGNTYTVSIDGEEKPSYSGDGTSFTPQGLMDGKHSYTITATDAAGNSRTVMGEFIYDSTPPEITLRKPECVRQEEGVSRVTLSWSGEKGATYTLSIDGGDAFKVEGTSYTQEKMEDGEHSYVVTATDAAGNSRSSSTDDPMATFNLDATAPEIELQSLSFTAAEQEPGMGKLTLSWASNEAGVTYTLKVDGKAVYSGAATSYSGVFKDGAHEYSLTATDESGNTSEQVGSFYYDASAPTLKPGKPKYAKLAEGQMEVTLSWKGELGASYRVEVAGQIVYEGTDSSCRFTCADGEHEYTLTATDAAGNSSTVTDSLSFDATAPEFSVPQEAPVAYDLKKGKGKVDFAWAGDEAGVTYTLMVDGKKAYSGKGTEKTLTLKDGEHSYSIIAKDKAGNSSEIAGANFSIDATAPVLTLNTLSLDASGKATLRWQASEAATDYTLTLYEGKDKVSRNYSLGAQEAGLLELELAEALTPGSSYSYSLTATDAKDNSSTTKKANALVAGSDTEAPSISELTHSVKDGKNGSASVTISWKGSEKGSTYTLIVDDAIAYVGTATKRTLTLEAGEHSYRIIATDKAGNRSEEVAGELTYDAPVVDQRAATLSWEPQAGSSYVLKVDNKLATPDADGSYNWAGIKDGKHKYTLTATDEAGNITTYSGSFVADTKAPKVTLGKVKTSKAGEGLMDVTLSWKSEKGATYSLTVDGESIELSDPTATSCTLRGLADGKHTYTVAATDAAGNESIATDKAGKGEFSYDATAPDIILGGISGVTVTSKGKTYTKASFSWAGEDGVSYTVMVDGKKQKVTKLTEKQLINGKNTTVTLSTLSVTTGNLAAGEHSYTIIAKDKAGNISTTTGCFTTDGASNTIWGNAESGIPVLSVIPDEAQQLIWDGEEDTEGFSSADTPTGAASGYSFALEEARQLLVQLTDLTENATVILEKVGGAGSITLASNGSAGLDRELSLSAGTYYLQVLGSDGTSALACGYTLDLELEKNGKKQPMQQASLAASL